MSIVRVASLSNSIALATDVWRNEHEIADLSSIHFRSSGFRRGEKVIVMDTPTSLLGLSWPETRK